MHQLSELIEKLNPAQAQAVQHTLGPAMIIAGAGSGKTRVLTHRIAFLISNQFCEPHQILTLTFTNKAAREMCARNEALLGHVAKSVVMGTFHSVFSKILRVEAEKIGFTRDFTIYDEDDSLNVIKNILKSQNIDDKKHKPRAIKHVISLCKNNLISPENYALNNITNEYEAMAAKVYSLYQLNCLRANAMDFDDLLVYMYKLLEDNPDMLHKYQHRFRFIMVDEYQDTNYAQYLILKKMAAVHQNIVVVGDDAQSIYAFRGASIQNILNFERDYPDCAIYKLEQNYRSTATIVEIGNKIITNNKYQIPKKVFTQNETGELVQVISGQTELEEASKIVDTLRELKLTKNYFNKDFAILYRTNAQSRVIEDSLRKANIFYKVFGGMSFYRRKEVKDAVAYLKLAINPKDEEALRRIINYPVRGIGDTTLNKIIAIAGQKNTSLWEVVSNSKVYDLGRSAGAVEEFATMIQSFIALAQKEDAHFCVDYITKTSGILKDLHKDNTTEGLSKWQNVQELINAAHDFVTNSENSDKSLSAFLSEIALFTDADQKIENDDYVSLMTVHAAKGLEFKVVFVVGLEDGLFPSSLSLDSLADLEEERRLFYVACTRAEKNLILSYAKTRFRYNEREPCLQSRFIDELDGRLLISQTRLRNEFPKSTPSPTPNHTYVKLKPLAQQNSIALNTSNGDTSYSILDGVQIGERVEHPKFGCGSVTGCEGTGPDARIHINFDTKGLKTLILKYARLKRL